MKEQLRILIIGLLAVSMFAGAVQAEERSRVGELRGTFVRLTEQRVGERGYLGVVIKPLEGREHATVLLSQSQQELVAMARELQEGQRLGVAYVTEAGHKWVRELAVERDRQARRRPDQERARRGTEALWARLERLEAMVEELHEQIARLRTELRESRGPREDPRREVRRERESRDRRAREERPQSEREVAMHQLEVMEMGLHALRQANRADAAELLTLAIRACEMMLEGRRDEEVEAVRERAPTREQLAEILSMAARLWREFDQPDKAAVVGQLAEQMAARERSRTNERGSRNESERDVAMRQLKIMRYTLHAIAEAGKKDAADLLERAIHARELLLEGRRDDEAMRVREGAPNRASQIEILMLAERILKELGQTERAIAVGRLAQELRGRETR
ncbi:MAG: hypothetical protein JSW59_13100 [Phycisphaerales bacterium]|nr:MAG: hypothetical protein JSW59_13100 [Phycisphaerales bacterium]